MKPRLSLLRQLLRSVLKNGDIKAYSYVMYLMTVGTRYLEENPFAFMANHHRHKLVTLEQRRLMLEHCFTEDDDPANMLEGISGKILVVSGTDDPVQPSRLLTQRISHLPNCKHKLYDCGHHVFLEHPQEFLDDIYEFYEQVNE